MRPIQTILPQLILVFFLKPACANERAALFLCKLHPMRLTRSVFLMVVVVAASCGLYSKNKDRIGEAVEARERAKGRPLKSYTIDNHIDTANTVRVYIIGIDSVTGNTFRDTLTFTTTMDGLVSE